MGTLFDFSLYKLPLYLLAAVMGVYGALWIYFRYEDPEE